MESFLDIIARELDKLVEEGVITKDELHAGIEIEEPSSELFKCSKLPENAFVQTIVRYMRAKNSEYDSSCEDRKKDPKGLAKISVFNRDGKVGITVKGNDETSEIEIVNSKDDEPTIPQFSPKKFIEEMIKNDIESKREETKGVKGAKSIESDLLEEILDKCFSGLNIQLVPHFENGLKEMAEEFGQKVKKIILEKEEKNKPPVIKAGKKEIGTRRGSQSRRPPTGATHPPRVNDEIPFEKRKEVLDSMLRVSKGDLIVEYETKREDSGQRETYKAYVYHVDRQEGGVFIVIEPHSSLCETRLIYIPEESLQTFVIEGKEKNGDFWKTLLLDYYVDKNRKEFAKEERCTSIYHGSQENYLSTIREIIERMKNTELPYKTKPRNQRLDRVMKRLLGLTRYPNIPDAVKEVHLHEVNVLKAAVEAAMGQGKKQDGPEDKAPGDSDDEGVL